MSQSLSCKTCGHVWHPRKASTTYRRQCAVCNGSEIDSTSSVVVNATKTAPTTANGVFASRTKLPPVIYDLEAISGASSPENALQRACELYKRLYIYKIKYNLESIESVFAFLEKETLAAHKKASISEAKLKDLLSSPELICYEVGGDLNAVHYFEALKESGYPKNFLDFVNEAVNGYWTEQGYELRVREKHDCG